MKVHVGWVIVAGLAGAVIALIVFVSILHSKLSRNYHVNESRKCLKQAKDGSLRSAEMVLLHMIAGWLSMFTISDASINSPYDFIRTIFYNAFWTSRVIELSDLRQRFAGIRNLDYDASGGVDLILNAPQTNPFRIQYKEIDPELDPCAPQFTSKEAAARVLNSYLEEAARKEALLRFMAIEAEGPTYNRSHANKVRGIQDGILATWRLKLADIVPEERVAKIMTAEFIVVTPPPEIKSAAA